ncbi:hypothetical protein Selin_0229 [Desulfurispirillum indicum S5]|uniref:Lcl C-terminal domain-containing protein n=1 Tax=Desulfurispirillum indicum (strain ATCC BAA-1389 / DSM 22839 / S5) TaxID=653733 RepID=E6W647_DESIS|nr:DUF1566 domain-containing protein [Desulfurispirillum indicum]ADU64986.1 hypothetical protein Selin_0229 [Desulfurispirillum indicum S5]
MPVRRPAFSLIVIILLIAGCGSKSSTDPISQKPGTTPPDTPAQHIPLQATIQGIAQNHTLQIQYNQHPPIHIDHTANNTPYFLGTQAPDTSYHIQIIQHPWQQLCSIQNPSGTITTHSQPVITITCATTKLNDTGIHSCATASQADTTCPQAAAPRQDADTGRDFAARQGTILKIGNGNAGFDFTKISADGTPLPPSSPTWSCVLDNHTGLMWESKSPGPGLHNAQHTYTWYNPSGYDDGGNPGAVQTSPPKPENCTNHLPACNTHEYIIAVNISTLCGSRDWRLPTREELRSIIDYSQHKVAIDTDYFPATMAGWYWSASPNADYHYFAWGINFGNANDFTNFKHIAHHVRLVRSHKEKP